MNQNCEIGAKIGCSACLTKESTKIEHREEKKMEKTNLNLIELNPSLVEAQRKGKMAYMLDTISAKVKDIKRIAGSGTTINGETSKSAKLHDNEIANLESLSSTLLKICENYEDLETKEDAEACAEWLDWKEESAHFSGSHRGFIVSICNNFQKAIRKGACGTIFTHHADKLVNAVGLLK